MTLIQSNDYDHDFLLSLDDPMPPMPNEFHDSITTPVLVTEPNERRESAILTDKLQKYNLTVNVFEVKLVTSEVNQNKEGKISLNDTISSVTSPIIPVSTTGTASKVNLSVKIEIDEQVAKTGRKAVKLANLGEPIVFNETFTFTFNTVLSQFLDNSISFRLLKTGKLVKGTKVLGKVDLDLISLYNEPGRKVKESSIPIFNEVSSELVGHLKCDLIIDLPNVDKKESLLPIIRPVTPISRLTHFESNAIKTVSLSVNIYSGEIPVYKIRTRDKIVSRIRSKKTSGLCVTVKLGDLEGSTSSVKRFTTPTWNECIKFNTKLNLKKPPNMTIKVQDKSGSLLFKPLVQTIDLSKIFLISGKSGSIYGPSYLVVKEVPKDPVFVDTCASGRILISISSKVSALSAASSSVTINSKGFEQSNNSNTSSATDDPSNKENSQSEKPEEPSVTTGPIDDVLGMMHPKEDEFTFLGVLYSSDKISKKFENRKLSYEVEIGHHNMHFDRCSSPSILDLTSISAIDVGTDDKSLLPERSTPIEGYSEQDTNKFTETSSILTAISRSSGKSDRGSISEDKQSQVAPDKSTMTTPLKPVPGEDDYLCLPLGKTRPLLGIEQMIIDLRHRTYVHNMIVRIREELEFGLTDVREMALVEHQDTCRRFRGVLEDLMVHCNRFLALTVTPSKYPKNELDILFIKYRQRELIKLSNDVKQTLIALNEANLSESLSTVTKYLGKIEDLLADPQDGFPDIMIYLLADNKRVGYLRLPASEIIFSRLENERGPSAGKVATYYIRSIKHPELIINRIQLYTWFGLKRHKRHSTSGLLPGYEESLALVFFQSLDGALPPHLIYQ